MSRIFLACIEAAAIGHCGKLLVSQRTQSELIIFNAGQMLLTAGFYSTGGRATHGNDTLKVYLNEAMHRKNRRRTDIEIVSRPRRIAGSIKEILHAS